MPRTALPALALGALLLAGCSPDPAGTAPGSTAVPAAGGTASTPASPRPSPSCPNPHGGTCLGPLEPGRYRTSTFQPRITYTVPAGWSNFEDLPGNFWLFPQGEPQDGVLGGSYLGIYQDVRAAAIDCAEAWETGTGTTPAELVAWYRSVPGLIVSEPRSVEIGGLAGVEVDLALEPGAGPCSYGPYRGIPLIIGNGVSDLHHVVLEEIDVRLVILGWRTGNVTLEITNVKERHSADEFRTALQPIIDSLRFDG